MHNKPSHIRNFLFSECNLFKPLSQYSRILIKFKEMNSLKAARSLVSRLRTSSSFSHYKNFSSFPSHTVVNMPALSPTMEVGTIAKWNVKEGDFFEAGASICEIETDKATMSFDAQDDGYIAKILIHSGEVKIGQPLLVTVEDEADTGKFASFTSDIAEAEVPPPAPAGGSATGSVSLPPLPAGSTPTPAIAAPTPVAAPSSSSSAAATSASRTDNRLFASPKAKKLAREGGVDWTTVAQILTTSGGGSGPNGRVLASDVEAYLTNPPLAATTPTAAAPARSAPAPAASVASAAAAARPAAAPFSASPAVPTSSGGAVYVDFVQHPAAAALSNIYVASKQAVPHYCLSVELNLTNLIALRARLNANDGGVSVFDCLVKAAAGAMKQVPDVNAAWMDSFVRQYENVDINVLMGSGASVAAPLLRNVQSKGFGAISQEMNEFSQKMESADGHAELTSNIAVGTFSIHDLGVFSVKSAAPIVLTPQACALSLGAITDTVVPNNSKSEGDEAAAGERKAWCVAPMLTATLSCDHRVVDGAVGAQWLSAFKLLVEQPESMLL